VSTASQHPGNGPYRVLLLSRDPEDPHFLIAAVALPEDILPTSLDATGRYLHWPEVTQWVAARLGEPVELTPIPCPTAWSIRPAIRNRPRGE
jgi:hypothetical protein